MNISLNAPSPLASGRLVRRCACGTSFLASRPGHDKCRRCHMARRRVEEAPAAVARAAAERRAEGPALQEALKTAWKDGGLPKSAAVRQSGRQIVICWMGRSVTFYT